MPEIPPLRQLGVLVLKDGMTATQRSDYAESVHRMIRLHGQTRRRDYIVQTWEDKSDGTQNMSIYEIPHGYTARSYLEALKKAEEEARQSSTSAYDPFGVLGKEASDESPEERGGSEGDESTHP